MIKLLTFVVSSIPLSPFKICKLSTLSTIIRSALRAPLLLFLACASNKLLNPSNVPPCESVWSITSILPPLSLNFLNRSVATSLKVCNSCSVAIPSLNVQAFTGTPSISLCLLTKFCQILSLGTSNET